MTPTLVSSAWTSTLSLSVPEAELVSEEDARPQLATSTKSPRMMLWNGSRENTTEQFTTDLNVI